jgi:hypothetical protein
MIPPRGTKADGPDRSRSDDVRGEILAYLNAHPRAADSLDGIVSWWLSRPRYQAYDRIQESLDELVETGLVERICLADGSVLYGKSQAGSTT